MGVFQDRKGKKFVLLLGLIIALIGLIIPIFGLGSFPLFLITILLLGAGATILQVAGNPIMRDVSREGKYPRNLSLGQFVKAIGSLSGPVIPVLAAEWFNADWKIIFPIYSIAILITIISVAGLNVKEVKGEEPASLATCLGLLKNGYVLMMVLAIFLYVGAEVSMSSGIPLYFEAQFGIDIAKLGVLGTGLFFTALVIGRFTGGVILNWMPAKRFFVITSILSVLGIIGLFMAATETVAAVSVFIIGLGFANIFPLVFSITVDHMPEKTNELSGLMITAIVGGAFLPPLMGVVADSTSVLFGFIVPMMAILYILITAFKNSAKTA
jgi:fucose permease